MLLFRLFAWRLVIAIDWGNDMTTIGRPMPYPTIRLPDHDGRVPNRSLREIIARI
jgi:hypothetical protein